MVSLFEKVLDTVASLRAEYQDCQRCSLKDRRTQVVFWDGPDQSPVLVCGEAPGENEDIQGIPFIGRAGIRWNQLLTHLNIDRNRLHTTNVCLCRPTDGIRNTKPNKEQIEACSTRLLTEIALCNPRVIVCLGAYAATAILGSWAGKQPVKELRKGWHKITINNQEIDVKVGWHPSYELRSTQAGNLSVNQEMLLDWKEIAQRVPQILGEEHE